MPDGEEEEKVNLAGIVFLPGNMVINKFLNGGYIKMFTNVDVFSDTTIKFSLRSIKPLPYGGGEPEFFSPRDLGVTFHSGIHMFTLFKYRDIIIFNEAIRIL